MHSPQVPAQVISAPEYVLARRLVTPQTETFHGGRRRKALHCWVRALQRRLHSCCAFLVRDAGDLIDYRGVRRLRTLSPSLLGPWTLGLARLSISVRLMLVVFGSFNLDTILSMPSGFVPLQDVLVAKGAATPFDSTDEITLS